MKHIRSQQAYCIGLSLLLWVVSLSLQGCRSEHAKAANSIQSSEVSLEENVTEMLLKNKEIGLQELDYSAVTELIVFRIPRAAKNISVVEVLDSLIAARQNLSSRSQLALDKLCEKALVFESEQRNSNSCAATLAKLRAPKVEEPFAFLKDLVPAPHLTQNEADLAASHQYLADFLHGIFSPSNHATDSFQVEWREGDFEYATYVIYSATKSQIGLLSYRISG